MDFLKKKMKELMDDDDKDKKPSDSHSEAPGGAGHGERAFDPSQGGYPPQQHQQYPPQGYPQQGYPPQGGYPPQQDQQPPGYPQQQPYGQPGYPQQQPYGQPGYGSPSPGPGGYGAPSPGPGGYGAPAPGPGGYGAPAPQGPPAPYGAPPPMPPGWTAQFDQSSQRWYYVEQATGRTQWELPAHVPGPYAPPPSGGGPGAPYAQPTGHDERGLFGTSHTAQGYGHNAPYNPQGELKKKDKGHSTAMLAAAGVGGLAAGAFIGHQLADDSSDDEHKAPAAAPMAAAPYGAPAPTGYDNHPAFEEPPPVPTHDADGDSISSSDRESLEEKRQELIEAQEEYEEELEEAYDD